MKNKETTAPAAPPGLPPFRAIADLVREHAAARPAAVALRQGARAVTWLQLDTMMDRVAATLQRDGVRPQQGIAICAANSLEYAAVFLGALRAGAVVAPLPTGATPDQLAGMVADSGARALFVDRDAPPIATRVPRIALDGSAAGTPLQGWLSPAGTRPQRVEAQPGWAFNIIYSSGTTGTPKGIVQPHQMRWAHVARADNYGYGPDSVTLVATSLCSNTTLVAFFPGIARGGTVVFTEGRFDPAAYLQLAERVRATHAMLVPVQYQRLMAHPDFGKYDLSSFRMKFCTSAPFSARLKADVLARWPGGLVEYYGMTEGGGTLILEAHKHPHKLHTVGQPADNHDIRLIDEAGREVARGEIGEVVGRSGAMMTAYHNQPGKTREAEWHDAAGNRFIRTGDVGRFDEDGFLTLLDRRKDMIISGGFNIYPSDIEAVLREHPAVADVAVVGVPSETWGESPVAFVVPAPGAPAPQSVRDWANARLGKVQRLVDLRYVGELPRSDIGKVLKRELRDAWRAKPPCVPQIRLYQDWLRRERGLAFDDYDALWRWSTTDLAAFWQSIWDYFELRSPTPVGAVLADDRMPGAKWFDGARFNYASQVLRHVDAAHAAGLPALVSRNEKGVAREISWPELKRQAASLALHLQAHGLQPGDRVAAYLPNVPETIVAFLAVASVGGIWSLCSPDMGTPAVLDRFRQIEPKVLIACDEVTYGGRDFDRRAVVEELHAALPTVEHVLRPAELEQACARDDAQVRDFEPVQLPFDHPLWIVYSSGTTGLPKPIVHGHGGIAVVMLAHLVLHSDIGCSYEPNNLGECFHWYSSTGWVMWNAQMAGLLNGTTCCIYDGNPGGSKDRPDWGRLWRFGAEVGATFFGAGAAFFANCMKAGVDLAECGDLSAVRALGTTGSPLSEEVQRWVNAQFERIGTPGMWWSNISGGTDFAGAFIGGNRELPLVPGEMQCRLLGCAVQAWNEQGEPVIGEVGELVCTRPIPSMPLRFWNDPGDRRYLSSYFDMYPGVWRHGDWLKITPQGGCIIYGRSDATINRHGLRMGTSELYAAVEALPEVLDSMVVDLEYLGRESWMPLFVVLRPGLALDDAMKTKINNAVRTALSPRFVPDQVYKVAEIPRTLTGKKQELPVKKLLLGQPLEKVVNRDAMANPGSMDFFVELAKARNS